MDATQARAAAKRTIEEFARREWKVRVHREISHPLDPHGSKKLCVRLVVRGRVFPVAEPLPDNFFSGADRKFELSFPVQSVARLATIRIELLNFLDELLGEMETTFVLDNIDDLARALLAQVSSVEKIGCFQLLGKLHLKERVFSLRQEVAIRDLLPPVSVKTIEAVAGMAQEK